MDESQALDALAALSQQTRLRMLRYLVTKGAAGASAGEIGAFAGAISSRTSFHLSALARAGLITATRKSRHVIYTVDFQAVGGLIAYLVQDCCQGNAEVLRCCAMPTDRC